MATTSIFNTLSAPAPEENMDMSSPANRTLDDDDIDIDFDDYQGGVELIKDEQMLEPTDPSRPATATDDIMEDDPPLGGTTLVEEEIMQEADDQPIQGVQQDEDEDLIDYSEDEMPDEQVDETVVPTVIEEPIVVEESVVVEEPAGNARSDTNDVAEEVLLESEPLEHEHDQLVVEELPAATALHPELAAEHEEPVAPISHTAEDYSAEDDGVVIGERPVINDLKATAAALDSQEQEEEREHVDEHSIPAPISLSTAVSVQNDTPGTPTDTGLHPMYIRYANLYIPLFKSRRQLDGLLKDDNLASLSLAELIRNCRQRIAIKIGENISEDQELVLGFEHLGLMLVEDSRAAFESSLNDVLDVYLQLHRNDGTQDIPPLSINLTVQLKFASSFGILKQAAAAGQGISTFSLSHPAAGGDEHHFDTYDDHYQPEAAAEDGVEHAYNPQDLGTEDLLDQLLDQTNAYQDHTEQYEEGEDEDREEEQIDQHANSFREQQDEEPSVPVGQGHEADHQAFEFDDQYDEEHQYHYGEYQDHFEDGAEMPYEDKAEGEHADAPPAEDDVFEGQDESNKPANGHDNQSNASSVTVQADPTEHIPEDDFSTLVNDYDEEEEGDESFDTVIHHDVEESEEHFGDDLGFDEAENEEAQHLEEAGAALTNGSPHGKRGFDELDEIDYDEPEPKKARAS